MSSSLELQIKSILPKLSGWCTEEKALAMANHIITHQPLVVVEIGVYGGKSLIPMALACKSIDKGRVFGIDPWSSEAALKFEKDPKNIEWWKKLNYRKIYEDFAKSVYNLELLHFCNWYRTEAYRAVHLFDSIDLLHIDGNHAEESASMDVRLYLPKVSTGGFVFFDDMDWESTFKAQEQLRGELEFVGTVDRTAIFRKPI